MNPVRVRFAPSPTGALHIGGLRTALYNFLLARQSGGTMILRIEDTDQGRFVAGAENYILESLKWAGIEIDEGPVQGGNFGPYRQSERKDIYRKFADHLISEGKAYYAFDSEAEIEAMRNNLKAEGSVSLQYDHRTRTSMNNSLKLSEQEIADRLSSLPYVIRMKVEPGKTVTLDDLIRGHVQFDSGQVDDKVLIKSDGMPTYHLANVVDDYLMKITHVIRGEEWLPSAPLHVLLYEAFGWTSAMPRFAHLPLLLRPDGNGKLSKRDADQHGFPIFPLNWKDPATGDIAKGYRESGYLPEAMINFLAFLGWNPGTEQEMFTMEELIKSFSIERIGRAGAKFDILKAKWYNHQYLKKKTSDELAAYLLEELNKSGISCSVEKAKLIGEAMRERITFPADLWAEAKFYHQPPNTFDMQLVAKKWTPAADAVLSQFAKSLSELSSISKDEAQARFEKTCAEQNCKPGQVLQLLRIALTGAVAGPDLMLSIEILGASVSSGRISTAVELFKSLPGK
jgi:glutamyl-tRNA synthetase